METKKKIQEVGVRKRKTIEEMKALSGPGRRGRKECRTGTFPPMLEKANKESRRKTRIS